MPPIVATIATIVAAAVGAGTTIYEATQQPGAPKLPKVGGPQTPQTNAAQTAAVSQALPNLQELTGGSVSPEYAASYGATQTGLGNNPQASGNVQAAINQFFGLSAPGDKGFTPESVGLGGGTNVLDLLKRMGNNGSTPLFPNSTDSGDLFRGLAT